MKQSLSAWILITALAATAAATRKPPAWTHGGDPRYPESRFMTGVGVGADLEAARGNARAELSRTLQARVQQTVTETQTEQTTVVGKKRGPAEGSQKTRMDTQVSTDTLLEGVVIKETHYDKKAKKHYALAVLDKMEARRSLSTQIQDRESVISAARAEAQKAESAPGQARALSRALGAARERDELAARRRLVDPAGMAEFPAHPTHQLQSDLSKVLSTLPITVEAAGPEGSRLREQVSAEVTALGLSVGPGGGNAQGLTLKAEMAVEPFDRGNPQWTFFQWRGSVSLSDNAGGRVIASAAREDQEGHLMATTAQSKARSAGEAALAREAGRLLSEYLFGQ